MAVETVYQLSDIALPVRSPGRLGCRVSHGQTAGSERGVVECALYDRMNASRNSFLVGMSSGYLGSEGERTFVGMWWTLRMEGFEMVWDRNYSAP